METVTEYSNAEVETKSSQIVLTDKDGKKVIVLIGDLTSLVARRHDLPRNV